MLSLNLKNEIEMRWSPYGHVVNVLYFFEDVNNKFWNLKRRVLSDTGVSTSTILTALKMINPIIMVKMMIVMMVKIFRTVLCLSV